MTRRRILGFAALLATVGFSLVMPGDAQARRCCHRSRRAYYTAGYNYAAPAATNCAPTAAPANPDGTMTPQPGQADAPPPPAPAPHGAFE